METTVKRRYETEAFTAKELSALKKMTLGYGNLQRTVDRVGIPLITFRTVLSKGYGFPETIKKIREALLNTKSTGDNNE